MKRRIHIELLVTSGLAILLTLTFAMFVFYGLFRSQIIRDLETDARVMKNMGVFDDISRMAEKNGLHQQRGPADHSGEPRRRRPV